MSRLVIMIVWLLGGFEPGAMGAAAHRLRVLTSFLPVYCFTVNVAGDLADVQNLLPPRVEPHDYQFSRKDFQKISGADVIVVNGLGLEKWLDKALEAASSSRHARVVELAGGLEEQLIHPQERAGFGPPRLRVKAALPNPHIWLDPQLAEHGVRNILEALQESDPAHADAYATNAASYLARLSGLEAEVAGTLRPIQGTPIVTYHAGFEYFARRFGLRVVGVVEPAADLQPSLKQLSHLYQTIRADHVQAIFCEPPQPTRLAWQIARDLRLPLAQLDMVETGALTATAYEDALRRDARVLLGYLGTNAARASK
jgi:ABC-type Zn uptake system ZnuABC Zn-binding protein ZnuA